MSDNLSISEPSTLSEKSILTLDRQFQLMDSNDFALKVSSIYSIQNNAKRVKTMLPWLTNFGAIPLTFIEARKDDEESVTYRTMGTDAHESKNHLEALELYSKSLAYATSGSENVSLAFANRSAVLFDLKQYAECIEDIDRAKKKNCPQTQMDNLKIRRETCVKLLNSSHLDLSFARMKIADVYSNKRKDMKESLEKNDEIPCASNSIKITFDKKYGRHVIATKDISAGDVIAIERPYSMSLLSSHLYTHCRNCFNRSLTLLPCQKCPNVMYCSVECRDTAWKTFHEIECPILTTLFEADYYDKINRGLMTVITAIKNQRFKTLKPIISETESRPVDRTSGFTKDNAGKLVLDSSNYTAVHFLTPILSSEQAVRIYKCTIAACSLLCLLRDHTLLKRILKDKINFEIFGGFVLHNLLSHSIYTLEIFETQSNIKNIIGGGMLPVHGLFNHSCYPNISLGYHYRKGQVNGVSVAIMPIKKGQPLWMCYSSSCHHAHSPKKVRQEMLFENFNFTCSCIACEKNFPLLEKLSGTPKMPDDFFDIYNLPPDQALDLLPKYAQKLNQLAKKYIFPKRYIIELQDIIVTFNLLIGHRPILKEI